jgi:hypothetical protein
VTRFRRTHFPPASERRGPGVAVRLDPAHALIGRRNELAARAQNWLRRTWRAARKTAEIQSRPPYYLRQAYASLQIRAGLSIPELAEQMGYSPQMTIGTYAHVIRELKGEPVVSARSRLSGLAANTVPADRRRPARRVPVGTVRAAPSWGAPNSRVRQARDCSFDAHGGTRSAEAAANTKFGGSAGRPYGVRDPESGSARVCGRFIGEPDTK